MSNSTIQTIIPAWLQHIFPLPQDLSNPEETRTIQQFYLLFLISIIICCILIPIFIFAERPSDALLTTAFLIFSALLLRYISYLPIETIAKLTIWVAFFSTVIGVWNSELGMYNPSLGAYYLLLFFAAFFTRGTLTTICIASILSQLFFFIAPHIGLRSFALLPAIHDLISSIIWITLCTIYLRYFIFRVLDNSERIHHQQQLLKNQQVELEKYRDDLEELVTQRTAELEESRQEAENAKIAAETASRAKSYFLANMSHELRTPLNAIIGYSEMTAETIDDTLLSDSQTKRELIGDITRIARSGQHLLSVINQVLDLSKIEADMMDLYLEETTLRVLVDKALSIIQPLARKRELTLIIQNTTLPTTTMFTDTLKVSQILVNLLSNAVKFTDRGSVTLVTGSIAYQNEQFISFTIHDTGIGMSSDMVARIFQPFWQAETSYTRTYAGTGLGLTITKRFCDALGGRITLTSKEGTGTSFHVLLPQHTLPRPPQINNQ